MKPILAIETSTATAGVALLCQDASGARVIAQSVQATAGHAESLLPMADALLAQAQISRQQLGLIAFGQGPGAFTGIRLACSVAQALGFALTLPLVSVNALQAVAAAVPLDRVGLRLVALDARMGEVYLGAYSTTGQMLQRPVLLAAHDSLDFIAPRLPWWRRACGHHSAAWLVGEGWQVVAPALGTAPWQSLNLVLHDDTARPAAVNVARVALERWKAGLTLLPEQALPLYLRDKVAFTTLERAHGLGGNPKVGAPGHDWVMPMMPLDLPAVVELERQSQAFPWTLRNFEDALAAGYPAWVARRQDRLVGFCVSMPTPDDIHVLVIAVAPDARNQGVGALLLGEVYGMAHELGLSKVLLEVRPSNALALRFYHQHGFVEIGRRKGYYPAGRGEREDALVMALDLTAA